MPDGLIARLSPYLGLEPATLAGLQVVASPFSVRASEEIFRQGEQSTGMYVVDAGQILIKARTPGDDVISMTQLSSGEIFGELSLLDDDDRSASAVALTDASGWWISRSGFRGLLHSKQPVANEVIVRIQQRVAQRIRDTLTRIADADCGVNPLRIAKNFEANWSPADASMAPMLQAFSLAAPMLAPRWEHLLSLARRVEISRGGILQRTSTVNDDYPLIWVVRGALRECLPRGDELEQLWVAGPGALAGVVGAVDGRPHPMVLQAAEDSVLLALPANCLHALHAIDHGLCVTLQDLVSRQIALAQRRINRHLGRAEGLRRFNQREGG